MIIQEMFCQSNMKKKKSFFDKYVRAQITVKIGSFKQGPRSLRKCAGAKGGTIFLGDFLLHFCAIWKNDPCSKSENVPGLKPRLPRRLRGPCITQICRILTLSLLLL